MRSAIRLLVLANGSIESFLVIMGLLFYPRGGSAFVVRYLSPALTQAG